MKTGRNDPCPCGSGKKHKKCCWGNRATIDDDSAVVHRQPPLPADDVYLGWLRRTTRANAAASIGALSLLGDGPWRVHSLERAAALACMLSREGAASMPPADPNELLKLLESSPMMQQWRMLDDPPESSFLDTVTCVGGDCLVYPGPSYEAVFAFKLLLKALARHNLEQTPIGTAIARGHALLLLSDAAAKAAGHSRHDFLPSEPPTALIDSRTFQQVTQALTFTPSRLRRALSPFKLPVEFVQPFICRNSRIQPEPRWDDHPLLRQPLVSDRECVVLATPGTVGSACVAHVFDVAHRSPIGHKNLVNALRRESKAHLDRLLRLMGWQGIRFLNETGTNNVSHAIYRFDVDKVAHVQLIVDEGERTTESMTLWPTTDALWQQIQTQREATDKFIAQEFGTPSELRLRLTVLSGFGRGIEIPAELNAGGPSIVFTLEALDALVLQRDADPLTLWRFGRALTELEAGTRVRSWSSLDTYAVYRAHDDSFYLSDDKPPTYLGIDPSMAREVREAAQRKNDIHAASLPSGDIALVTLFWGPFAPVYVTERSMHAGPPEFVVEHGQLGSTWVCLSSSEAPESVTRDLLEAIAYWCWQLSSILQRKAWPLIGIRVAISGTSADWDTLLDNSPVTVADAAIEVTGARSDGIDIRISSGLVREAATADNRADRLIVRCLLQAAQTHFAETRSASDEDDLLLDEIAPLGSKKKLLAVRQVAEPALWDGDLAALRKLQGHDIAHALDGVAERLARRLEAQVPWDPIPHERYKELFDALRQDLLDRIGARLMPFDGVHVLERLIRANECVVHARAQRALWVVPSMACFEGSERSQELVREHESLDRVGLVTRIAIEMVAASRPNGTRILSDDDLDQFLALIDGYCGACVLAEETRCRVYPHRLALLASGRLGIDPQPRSLAKHFWPAKRHEVIKGAIDVFERYWEPRVDRRDPDKAARFEAAFRAEFGVDLATVQGVMNALFLIAVERDSSCITLHQVELVQILGERGVGSECDIIKVVDLFALDERDSWATPPDGFERSDIDPARYKRRLSYLTRPLIRSRQLSVTWGPRHVLQSWEHLLGMLVLGRMPHANLRSKAMLEYWGIVRNEIGKSFERSVAEALQKATRMALHRNLGIGPGERFPHASDLGDFDVLMCDVERRALFCLECKATDFGRSPAEISQEADSFLRGERGKKSEPSRVEAHQRRVAWLKANWIVVARELSLATGSWRIVPVIVTSSLLPSPYLIGSPIPFRALAELLSSNDPWTDLLGGPWVESAGES